MALQAAVPYTQATVTRLQNKVTYGDTSARATRPARVSDTIRAQSYLLTETDSRAELRYEDGSIVRIGQNTVFTFEADTRTLQLERGSLVFYIPKGSGGGTIRTASITAAITGTLGKVSSNTIAILEGEVTLVPSGRKVSAGFFARVNPDGTITIARFDPSKALDGKLMTFNGPMPGFDERTLHPQPPGYQLPDLSTFDMIDRAQNQPSSIQKFFPPPPQPDPPVIRNDNRVVVPPPTNNPPMNQQGGGRSNY